MIKKEEVLPPRVGTQKSVQLVTLLKWLVAGALGLLLYFAHMAFVPVALALLASLVLSGPVEGLHAWHVPRALSAAVLLIALLGAVVALGNLFSEPAQQWFNSAPHTIRVVEKKFRPVAQVMARIDSIRNSAGNIGSTAKPGTPQAAAPAPEETPISLIDALRGVVVSFATVVILSLFLLAGGPPMLARMAGAFASDIKRDHIIMVIEEVRREVGRFYATSTLINVGLGIATGFVMMWCGMPNPFLWGTVAAVLNFIPYAGPTATLLVLTLVAVVSFEGLGQVLAVAGSFLALTTVEGQFVQPLLVGRRLKLNPMLVFLALWFGGLFWGIPGIILATPSLAALKVIAAHSRGGEPLLNFLSPHTEAEDDAIELEVDTVSVAAGVPEAGPLPPAA
ncbi:MAG TPA: AI-2E family transporter [Steroidobacteraceae bacterium]